ncbi:MAG TPA: helix-turn-helix transcriptional regulator [Terriglobales bacterium]|jgi:transcriptional regulator with XRE-family HTH domain|nr:helix-turn-helix transcriptional regulator [Terriglobales bacterium]
MPKRTLESLGRLVREKRGAKKIRETAKEIGIGTATLMRIENGRIPDVETFGKICKWLNIDPGSFLGFEPISAANTAQTLTAVSTLFKADQNPQPATVQAIAQMVLLAMKTQPGQEDSDA